MQSRTRFLTLQMLTALKDTVLHIKTTGNWMRQLTGVLLLVVCLLHADWQQLIVRVRISDRTNVEPEPQRRHDSPRKQP